MLWSRKWDYVESCAHRARAVGDDTSPEVFQDCVVARFRVSSRSFDDCEGDLTELLGGSNHFFGMWWLHFGEPKIHLPFGVVFQDPVPLLESTDELVLLAGNLHEVVVGEFAPTRFDIPGKLKPLAFDLVPIHDIFSPV